VEILLTDLNKPQKRKRRNSTKCCNQSALTELLLRTFSVRASSIRGQGKNTSDSEYKWCGRPAGVAMRQYRIKMNINIFRSAAFNSYITSSCVSNISPNCTPINMPNLPHPNFNPARISNNPKQQTSLGISTVHIGLLG